MDKTPLNSFIDYKNDSKSQCGNYSIDIPKLSDGEQYRFHFDMTACVGCHCCEAACNELQGNPPEVKWRRVGEIEGGEFPNTIQLFNSMSCNHCIDPACLNGCPSESYIKLENGIVKHIDETCIGCQYCTWNCPYEVPVFNKDRGIVTKCDMCVDKLSVGETPACVQACPAGAIEIEVVNKDQWIKNDLKEQGIAPMLPDVEITKPTTRYTLPKDIPNNLKKADDRFTLPAHSEWPLIFMTILTQISLGGFLAITFGEILNFLNFNLVKPNFYMVLITLLPIAIGLPLSALHLGRPKLAILAFKNFKKSPLSKEAVYLGIFMGFITISMFLYLFEANSFIKLVFDIITLYFGIQGIYYQSLIYRVPARPAWNRKSTTKRFFGTSYLGFLLIAIFVAINNLNSAIVLLSISLLAGMGQILVIYEEIMFYKYLNKEHKDYYELNKTKQLLERFSNIKNYRLYSLIASAIILPFLAILFSANNSLSLAIFFISLSFVIGFSSEIAGRYLFYTSVYAKGLAGNFFAKNQR